MAPDAGRALVGEMDVAADPAAARRLLAYVPEQVSLYDEFTGLENLAYFAELAGRRPPEAELRALLADADLQADAHARRVGTYSKGMWPRMTSSGRAPTRRASGSWRGGGWSRSSGRRR